MQLDYINMRNLLEIRLAQISDAALEHPQFNNEAQHLKQMLCIIDNELINQKQYSGWTCPPAVGSKEEVDAVLPPEKQKIECLKFDRKECRYD